MGHLSALAGVLALTGLFDAVTAQSCSGVTGRYQPKMGSGYRVSVLASGLRQPRHIVVDSAGNLLVAEGGSTGVRRLVLQDNGNIVCASSNTQILTGSVSRYEDP
jgi:glucose/arabinose dehydrogenase